VIFFHDEPEFQPPMGRLEPNPCEEHGGGGHRDGHGDGGHEELPPIMPISYRTEPMVNRERRLWRMIREGTLKKQVTGEEQHHSSWLFGDPATPILRAYAGDPIRIRLVHGGIKETHVFHLHVYQWHAALDNRDSPLIDSISISPQTGHTIAPLYGAGTRQGAIGDAIWHCHLYPHFHEGMWGLLRTFDRRHNGSRKYPDGTEIKPLMPLPDREPPPAATDDMPGFPGFMAGAGEPGQKSPLPPWPESVEGFGPMPADLDYRPITSLEEKHLNCAPKPGALFIRFPFAGDLPEVKRDLAVISTDIEYNDHGWHDPQGHMFVLAKDVSPDKTTRRKEPLIVRGHQQTVVQTTLQNLLPPTFPGTPFDPAFPPCEVFGVPLAECGLHVHLVKFDPLAATAPASAGIT
jgi:hypothetical protein